MQKSKNDKRWFSVHSPTLSIPFRLVSACDFILLFDGVQGAGQKFSHLDTIDQTTILMCAQRVHQPLTEDCRWQWSAKFGKRKANECEWPIFGLCTLDWNFGLNWFCMENESSENWNWPEKKNEWQIQYAHIRTLKLNSLNTQTLLYPSFIYMWRMCVCVCNVFVNANKCCRFCALETRAGSWFGVKFSKNRWGIVAMGKTNNT